MSNADYWEESIGESFIAVGASALWDQLSPKQKTDIGESVGISHDNYSTCRHVPDRYDSKEREDSKWKRAHDDLRAEFDAYREASISAVKRYGDFRNDANISIDQHGWVTNHGS